MKIFIAIFGDDPHRAENPFVSTLEGEILSRHNDIEFASQQDLFWNEDNWDIIHIMWPDVFVPAIREGKNLYERLLWLKQHGTKVVSTIHNFWSHSHSAEEDFFFAYQIVYSLSDLMIHLGEYSKYKFEGLYHQAKHIVIPHHVYNTIYPEMPEKKNALVHLGYKDGVYVLVFGAFRHIEEKNLMFSVVRNNPNIRFIIPRLYDIPHGKLNWRWLKQRIKYSYYKLVYPNLMCSGETFVSEANLKYYYAATDISFIPRMNNLNSGNLPLGMLMGHVIVGPSIGNVGELIRSTQNFTYEFGNYESIKEALNKALAAVPQRKGEKNREYALKNWNTKKIAEMYYNTYKSLCNN